MLRRYEILLDFSSITTKNVDFNPEFDFDIRNIARILDIPLIYRNFAPEASRVAMKPTNRSLKYRWQRW